MLSVSAVLCQNRPVKIAGTVTDINSAIPAPNVQIYLLKNNDTLSAVNTDSLGTFLIETNFSNHGEYSLLHNFKGRKYDKIVLQNTGDSAWVSEYEIELSIFISNEEKFNSSVYFELKETHDCQNFEPVWFKALLEEYPNMCLEFTQYINPKESERIAQKRMINFRKMLFDIGCDMNRIRFSENPVILQASLLQIDPRSRIQSLVVSMDGSCN